MPVLIAPPPAQGHPRLTCHARRLVLQNAEVAVTRELFAQILYGIRSLSPVPT